MEQFKVELVHSGQDRRYGDYYYRYEITTQEKMEDIFQQVRRQVKKQYGKIIPNINFKQYKETQHSVNDHFKSYYGYTETKDGYLQIGRASCRERV